MDHYHTDFRIEMFCYVKIHFCGLWGMVWNKEFSFVQLQDLFGIDISRISQNVYE